MSLRYLFAPPEVQGREPRMRFSNRFIAHNTKIIDASFPRGKLQIGQRPIKVRNGPNTAGYFEET